MEGEAVSSTRSRRSGILPRPPQPAARRSRVKAIAVQIPGIGGDPEGTPPQTYTGAILQDAILRARTGQGAEMSGQGGFQCDPQ